MLHPSTSYYTVVLHPSTTLAPDLAGLHAAAGAGSCVVPAGGERVRAGPVPLDVGHQVRELRAVWN